MFCGITTRKAADRVTELCFRHNVLKIEQLSVQHLRTSYKVFINGKWIGSHSNPIDLVQTLKLYRKNLSLSWETGIVLDRYRKSIRIFTDGGRLIRPVLVVDQHSKEILLKNRMLKVYSELELDMQKTSLL